MRLCGLYCVSNWTLYGLSLYVVCVKLWCFVLFSSGSYNCENGSVQEAGPLSPGHASTL